MKRYLKKEIAIDSKEAYTYTLGRKMLRRGSGEARVGCWCGVQRRVSRDCCQPVPAGRGTRQRHSAHSLQPCLDKATRARADQPTNHAHEVGEEIHKCMLSYMLSTCFTA